MTIRALEQRLAALEQEVAVLKASFANGAKVKDWESTVGMFHGDEVMRRIADNALRFREEDRRKARRKINRASPKQ